MGVFCLCPAAPKGAISTHPATLTFTLVQHNDDHSWFAIVVGGNELGPVYSFQPKQLKYEEP